MKTLIAEDDASCSILLQKFLSPYGTCKVAVDGLEAVAAFKEAHEEKEPFDLVCLDIMMPGMDGQEVLKEIRKWEELHGILGLDGVKIVMTTALDDNENILTSFREQCEAYVVKPLEKNKLLTEIKLLGLL